VQFRAPRPNGPPLRAAAGAFGCAKLLGAPPAQRAGALLA
jgi:hypothetical protein